MPVETSESTNPIGFEEPVIEDLTSFINSARTAALSESGEEVTQDTGPVGEADNQGQDPQETVQDDPELDKPFAGTRREAYRLAEERARQLKESEEKVAKVTQSLEEYRVADEALSKDVQAALSTDSEYRELEAKAREGDRNAGLMLNQIDANRAFFNKLQSKAARDISTYFTAKLVEAAKTADLPDDVVFSGSPHEIVTKAIKSATDKVTTEMQGRIDELETELRAAKVGRAGSRSVPLASGGRSGAGTAFDELFDENGRLKEAAIQSARRGLLANL